MLGGQQGRCKDEGEPLLGLKLQWKISCTLSSLQLIYFLIINLKKIIAEPWVLKGVGDFEGTSQ